MKIIGRLALLLSLWNLSAAPALAQATPFQSGAPVMLEAKEIVYDQQSEIATAQGEVLLTQKDQLLRADTITFDRKRNVVIAVGKVSLQDKTGQTNFAERAELTGDLRQGFVDRIAILLADNSRFAAQEGERVDGRYIILRRAVYSACDLCKDDPKRPPLWQLKASKVMQDNVAKRVTYRDAWLEVAGVPVAYTPYFSHPDPSVKRQTGFLTPQAGSNANIGLFARVPYYIDLAPDKDLTLSPTLSDKDGVQLAGEYRQRFRHGAMVLDGSAVVADRVNDKNIAEQDRLRGHLFGKLQFDLGDYYRAGAKLAVTSDKSYLYRYRIPTEDVLENRAYLDYFRRRNFFSAEGFYFQDLRPGQRQVEPLVLRANYAATGAPNQTVGGRWDAQASIVALTRNEAADSPVTRGPDSRRMSLDVGWERQLVSSTGLVAAITGRVRGDVFVSNRLQDPNDPQRLLPESFSGRVLPVGNLSLRYPLGRQGKAWRQIIEPIVAVTASPQLKRGTRIANEDSQGSEFDATNLFALNRFSGYDLYETGERVTYGIRSAAFNNQGGRYDLLLGSSYRLNEDAAFSSTSGLRFRQADFVASLIADPVSWFGVRANTRLNQETFEPRMVQLDAFAGVPEFRPIVQYFAADGFDGVDQETTLAEITYGFSTNFMPYWTFATSQRRSLRGDSGPRATSFALQYGDECTTAELRLNQDKVSRPDLSSGTSFVVTLYLRNLGGIKTDAISAVNDRRTPENP
jgi:LPS-assembly protein